MPSTTYVSHDSDEEDTPWKTKKKLRRWDIFEDPPQKLISGSMADGRFFDRGEKILKVVAYVLTFTIVLASAVISKGTLFFMTSQIGKSANKAYCNKKLGRNKQFVVSLPDSERVAWIWVLFFAYCIPQAGTFIRSVRISLFKKWNFPTFRQYIILFLTEIPTSIGSAILIYTVLPNLDVIKGAMLTNAVCFVPIVLAFITRKPRCKNEAFSTSVFYFMDIFSILSQTSAFVVWPLVENKTVLWFIPVSVFLISIGWWENFISKNTPINYFRNVAIGRSEFGNDRYISYISISLLKCTAFFVTMIVAIYAQEGEVNYIFDMFSGSFQEHDIFIEEIKPIIDPSNSPNISQIISIGTGTIIKSNNLTPLWVLLINAGSTYICYIFVKFSCKILIHGFGFAFPINLTMPLTLSVLIGMIGQYVKNDCFYYDVIPSYLFFDIPPVYYLKDFLVQEQSWIWLLWLLSQAWITLHIWTVSNHRLAPTEKIFMRPMYDAFLIDQDVALNRRRISEHIEDDIVNEHEVPTIYACGTMWHETKEEMMEFLKSILRLDEDQCARRIALKLNPKKNVPDFYNIESHILFDDAFTKGKVPKLNSYVKDLMTAVNDAASLIHEEENFKLNSPYKISTPYGGQLVWTLPGNNKLIAHLKDKTKIRPKKRWSQVMYMYYLLGYKLVDTHHDDHYINNKSENTFILALDGDIDFQPKAVLLLIDLMKKKGVGAACGRIHPIGSGPMVWYQKFEYAIGHWLQKATEHMIGCVLCSPGCFSLFRAKALMEPSVMKKYTTVSDEAIHYVQYDQGEDRWLCTLLLQRGYKVEYSAASDAYTHAPEGFNEFYNQRRRWIPSTTANIFDLLLNYKRTIKMNENISQLYIGYQIFLMMGSVLGPGTIFLMLVGSFVAAFQMDQWSSFFWNLIPILIFMIACKFFKENVQLFLAGLISAIYGLVMMAVLVGIMLQIYNDGFLAPSSLFFFLVAGQLIFTALMHPRESGCLVFGVVYFVTVPSMYMLLIIYSIFNMNNVSWGTRDTPQPQAGEEPAKPTEGSAAKQKKELTVTDKFMNFMRKSEEEEGSLDFSVAGLFRCMLCTHPKNSVEKYQLEEIKSNINIIMKKLDDISHGVEVEEPITTRRKTILLKGETGKLVDIEDTKTESHSSDESPNDNNPWMDDLDLDLYKFPTDYLPKEEIKFWKGLIETYLSPEVEPKTKEELAIYNTNAVQKLKILSDLRDKSVSAFFMLNALFVLTVFLLTLKKEFLHINWPFGVKTNFTYFEDTGQVRMYKMYLELEPIGMVFLFFFFLILAVQFFAMLLHRFATLCQILSNTDLTNLWESKKKKLEDDDDLRENHTVEYVKKKQKLKIANNDNNHDDNNAPVERRKTMSNVTNIANKRRQTIFLEEAFEMQEKSNNIGSVKSKSKIKPKKHAPKKSIAFSPTTYTNEAYEHGEGSNA